jgi:hypothetical protein
LLDFWKGSISRGVCGIQTNDLRIAKDGSLKSKYTPGIDLFAKEVAFGKGSRGY